MPKVLSATVLMAFAFFGPFAGSESAFAATPNAGTCSVSANGLICNAADQTLDFSKTATVTQTASGNPVNDIDPDIGVDNSVVYQDVFPSATQIIDARLTVTSRTDGIVIDQDEPTVDEKGIWTFVGSGVSTATNTEYTVSFFERGGDPARMLNVGILVKDLDGGKSNQDEYAAFKGLNDYYVKGQSSGTSENSVLLVSTEAEVTTAAPSSTSAPGAEEPDPETGVRQFINDNTVNSGGMVVADEEAWVAVKFDSVTSIAFEAGNRGTGEGGVGFVFTAISTAAFTDDPFAVEVTNASYTVTYDANGGDAAAPSAQTFTGAENLSQGAGMSKSRVAISSWNTAADGEGDSYPLGFLYTAVQDVRLYAIYEGALIPKARTSSSKGSCDSGIFLTVTGRISDALAASPVIYGSCALTPGTPYLLTVEPLGGSGSSKRMLGSGLVGNSGAFERTTFLPIISSGNYKVVLTSSHPLGHNLTLTNPISVNADRTYSSISAESLQPNLK